MPAAEFSRASGLLLHPSSLPGPYGIGDLGPVAEQFVETLSAAKQSWWQILPLGPTGYGDSPYQSYSAFAGNINLLSPDWLIRDGLAESFSAINSGSANDQADFDRVGPAKQALVQTAWEWFKAGRGPGELRPDFDRFREAQKHWLDDYSLFMAARDAFGKVPLVDWPSDIRRREPAALAELEKKLLNEVQVYRFGQYLFERQWSGLRRFAAERGVRFIGDAPIFVAGDSADVWAHADQFLLNEQGRPNAVAGVPPDYFSADGQLWGNPLYDWKRMAETDYSWWAARLRRNFEQVDLVRLDHFRGFAAAWHVPANDSTARNGRWVDGPRHALFESLERQLGNLPIIAEDLGVITPDVDELRLRFGFPGMRVLQFMLGGPDNPYWPHNFRPGTIAYTGTHDNDTTVGWYEKLGENDRKLLDHYLGHPSSETHWELIRMAWSSVAVLAIAPLQDLLGLGKDARMNTPGIAVGNWRWRVLPEQFNDTTIERLAHWTTFYNRAPGR